MGGQSVQTSLFDYRGLFRHDGQLSVLGSSLWPIWKVSTHEWAKRTSDYFVFTSHKITWYLGVTSAMSAHITSGNIVLTSDTFFEKNPKHMPIDATRFAWQRNFQVNIKQLSYSKNFPWFFFFQAPSSLIIQHLLIRLRFFELIFYVLWMDPFSAISSGIQHRLCAPICHPFRRVFAHRTEGKMCSAHGLFLGARSLFRSLISRPGYDQRWLAMAVGFELLT